MGDSSANWEMDLTLAEVVRDQKHISRIDYFISAEHFSGILLPSGQEVLFIILRDADSHHYIHLWYTEINGKFPTGRCGTLENMQSWLLISNSQFFCYLAQLSKLCLCWGPQPLSPSVEDRRAETSRVNIKDALLFSLMSFNCDCRCWSQGAKVGHVLGRIVSGLLHPEAVLALELLEQFPAVHIGAESLFLLLLC